MVATLHSKPGAAPGVDNLILVSSDTHIGPKLSQLREYCPAQYLEQFERNATANGMVVHWARDAAELKMRPRAWGPNETHRSRRGVVEVHQGEGSP